MGIEDRYVGARRACRKRDLAAILFMQLDARVSVGLVARYFGDQRLPRTECCVDSYFYIKKRKRKEKKEERKKESDGDERGFLGYFRALLVRHFYFLWLGLERDRFATRK